MFVGFYWRSWTFIGPGSCPFDVRAFNYLDAGGNSYLSTRLTVQETPDWTRLERCLRLKKKFRGKGGPKQHTMGFTRPQKKKDGHKGQLLGKGKDAAYIGRKTKQKSARERRASRSGENFTVGKQMCSTAPDLPAEKRRFARMREPQEPRGSVLKLHYSIFLKLCG